MLKQLFYSGPSFEVLHEEYAKKGRIDEEAPVEASHEVRIEAPVERRPRLGYLVSRRP